MTNPSLSSAPGASLIIIIEIEDNGDDDPSVRRRKFRSQQALLEFFHEHEDYHVWNEERDEYEPFASWWTHWLELQQGGSHQGPRLWKVQRVRNSSSSVLAIQGNRFTFDGTFSVDPKDAGSDNVTLFMENHESNVSGTTAAHIWDGSLLLAQHVRQISSLLGIGESPSPMHVLELGAGFGLAGMALAVHCQAQCLTLTDLPGQLERLRTNAARNQGVLPRQTVVAPCDWNRPEEFAWNDPSSVVNVIVAADCVWMEELVRPLFVTIEHFFTVRGKEDTWVVISYQRRGKATDQLFWSEVNRIFGRIEMIPTSDEIFSLFVAQQ